MRRNATAIVGVLAVAALFVDLRAPSGVAQFATPAVATPGGAPTPVACAGETIAHSVEIVLRLRPDDGDTPSAEDLARTRDVVAGRAEALSPQGCRVWTDGEDELLVQLAGGADAEATALILATTTRLEIVDPGGEILAPGTRVTTIPAGTIGTPDTLPAYPVIVDGDDVAAAYPTTNQIGQMVIAFELTPEATDRFCAFTSGNVGRPLSIVLDGTVVASPIVNSPICGGQGIIEGLSVEEVEALVIQLQTGALPVRVEIVSAHEVVPVIAPPTPAVAPTSIATALPYAGDPLAGGCWARDQVVSRPGERPQWSAPPAMVVDPTATYVAVIETSKGSFRIELDTEAAPITANNFVCLARAGYYDGTPVHRIIAGFVVQAGDPTGTGRGDPGYRFDDEPPVAGRSYARGTVAMANAGPNTNGSQFFVCLVDLSRQLPPNYTIFGQVVEGMEVVDAIAAVAVGPNPQNPAELSSPREPVMIEEIAIVEERATAGTSSN